jgi:hypothetical protein
MFAFVDLDSPYMNIFKYCNDFCRCVESAWLNIRN